MRLTNFFLFLYSILQSVQSFSHYNPNPSVRIISATNNNAINDNPNVNHNPSHIIISASTTDNDLNASSVRSLNEVNSLKSMIDDNISDVLRRRRISLIGLGMSLSVLISICYPHLAMASVSSSSLSTFTIDYKMRVIFLKGELELGLRFGK
jgi:hypothetical protein